MNFQPGIIYKGNNEYKEKNYWLIFKNGDLLETVENGELKIPVLSSPEEYGIKAAFSLCIGMINGKKLWVCEASEEDAFLDSEDSCVFKNIRELFPVMDNEMFALILRAVHLKTWDINWKFCPFCGGKLRLSETETAKICTACSRVHYPAISPAIIVAVRKGKKLLLAHNNRFPKRIRYSILAGFVEAGESLEETVEREVFEEVGIKIKNIKYFGSQSWPFPQSLMLGFTAEYESGEIAVDNVEIGHADWYSADNMPPIPPHGSISRELIEDFRKNYG